MLRPVVIFLTILTLAYSAAAQSADSVETQSAVPTEVENLAPAVVESPAPVETKTIDAAPEQNFAPTEVENPAPVVVESPDPTATQSPDSAATPNPVPVEAKTIDAAPEQSSTPAEVQSPAPVVTQNPASVETKTIDAVAAPKPAADDKAHAQYFNGMQGCFLLYNIKTRKFEMEIGGSTCHERFVACSTFKIPLAVMAFDAGLLKNEDEVLKWDGTIDPREALNRDHNARTWIKDSVVWFSQQLTELLGEEQLQAYLAKFQYGNRGISGGITQAWLVAPGDASPALAISPYEQAAFMKSLWADDFPVSSRATQIARSLIPSETSAGGWTLSGKTGSNSYVQDKARRLGWFIAHLSNGGQEYISVAYFSDILPSSENISGGEKAKEITKKILSDKKLW